MTRHSASLTLGALTLALSLGACSPKDAADGGTAAAGGAAPSGGAASSTSGGGAIDERALGTYKLTTDKLNKTIQASQNIVAAEKADPGLRDRWRKDEDDDQNDIRTDLAQLLARIEGEPAVRRAVESAGISPRDFVMTTFAAMSASVAAEMKKSGVKQDSGLGSHVSDDNVAFANAHQQDITRLMQAAK